MADVHSGNDGSVAFAEGVFTWPSDDPRLIGGRCTQCGAITFPVQSGCPRCGSTEIQHHELPARGTLWTFTTQEFLPKEPYAGGETPETFRPYGVGMVELGDDVRVEARLTEADPEVLRIGMEVELAIVPFRVDEDGNEVMTYAFRPS
jgi:uncharacterized OB-fold protein